MHAAVPDRFHVSFEQLKERGDRVSTVFREQTARHRLLMAKSQELRASIGNEELYRPRLMHRLEDALAMISAIHNTVFSDEDLAEEPPGGRLNRVRALLRDAGLCECHSIVELASPAAGTATATATEESLSERLTPREVEVLTRIAEGHSTKQIAGMLGITFKTAACHRYRVMDKLDIHETASLVRYAIREGMVAA
jgi:DNA-binding CsgD family transcriptional regulator